MTDAARDDTGPGAVSGLAAANHALRFLLELAALAALAYWGFQAGSGLVADVALGLGAPLLAAVVWGTFAAPRSARRLRGAGLVAVQLAVFAAATAALAAAGRGLVAAAFATLVAVNFVLMELLEQRSP